MIRYENESVFELRSNRCSLALISAPAPIPAALSFAYTLGPISCEHNGARPHGFDIMAVPTRNTLPMKARVFLSCDRIDAA